MAEPADPLLRSISGYTPADYEAEALSRLSPDDRLPVFAAQRIPGLRPLVWEGAVPPAGETRARFFPEVFEVPEIRIDRWRDVRVAGAGIMFTQDKSVLYGAVPVGGAASQLLQPFTELDLSPEVEQGAFSCSRLQRTETLDSAILIARAAPGNYHHVLTDIVPRARVIAAALDRPALSPFGERLLSAPILINHDTPPWAVAMLEAVGLDRKRLFFMPRDVALQVGALYVPHLLNDFAHWVSPEINRFYAPLYAWAKTQVPSPGYGPRLFTLRREMRHDRRRFHNIDEIAAELEGRGFVEARTGEMSWPEQIVAFAEAEQVVAAMGSNISNMLFCKPGTRTLILHPEDSVYSLNVGMAAAGKQEIGYLWADCFSNRLRGEHVELYQNVAFLSRALDTLSAPAAD